MNKLIKNTIFTLERNYNKIYFLSFILLVLVCLPRFNQNNFWIIKNYVGNNGHLGEYSIDTQNYIDIIDYYKGEKSNIEKISVPYIYRVLPTFTASLLPFDSLTNLNLLNLFSLLIALWIQLTTLEKLKINRGIISISSFLFVFNFPTFYFGTSGVVDPFLILLFYIILYSIIFKNNILFFSIMLFAALSKETTIILIPFYFVFNGINKESFFNSMIAFVIFIIGTYLSRNVIPLDSNYVWTMDYENLIFNLGRIRSYFSYIISYSYFLPIIFYFIYLKYYKSKIEYSLITGVILANMIFIYSFFAAYPDSRLTWTAYPFTILYISISMNKNILNSAYNVK